MSNSHPSHGGVGCSCAAEATVVTVIEDGQPQVVPTTVPIPIYQIGDGQIQGHTTPCGELPHVAKTTGSFEWLKYLSSLSLRGSGEISLLETSVRNVVTQFDDCVLRRPSSSFLSSLSLSGPSLSGVFPSSIFLPRLFLSSIFLASLFPSNISPEEFYIRTSSVSFRKEGVSPGTPTHDFKCPGDPDTETYSVRPWGSLTPEYVSVSGEDPDTLPLGDPGTEHVLCLEMILTQTTGVPVSRPASALVVTLSVFSSFFQVTFGMTKVFPARGPGFGNYAICPERHVTDTCGTRTDDGSVNYATTESSRPPTTGALTTKKAMFAAALRDIFYVCISWPTTMRIIIFHSYRFGPWDRTLP
ncbi:covalently-linked cell wall protein [Colletotrichum musicola]|uniref:Covalently-linked cell wall protein n=1 Tax=Colletotrichum musicola TaxID=2175873 RepID=A0A8H6NI63_9PEZI|nr:covalently-linked cell wall protein [Colletotrichum musicola]